MTDALTFPALRPLMIGPERIDIPVFLAPMAGVTDLPFRRLVKKFGAGLVISEMIASQAMIRENVKTLQMAQHAEDHDIPVVLIAGSDPEVMAEAARLNVARGVKIIDLNFGCPVKKIVNGHAGSALMRDEVHAAKIMEAVVKAVPVPVTVKMRLGWNAASLNAPSLAKIAEECGIKMVTVHGRTRCQFYEGQANWTAIRAVKEAVRIPVIANGDIHDEASATEALKQSGADGLMIGRAVYGRPWLLRQIMDYMTTGHLAPPPDFATHYATMIEHFDAMIAYYGPHAGLRIARKHIGWYSKGLPQSAEFRSAVNTTPDATEARALIDAFFQPLLARAA